MMLLSWSLLRLLSHNLRCAQLMYTASAHSDRCGVACGTANECNIIRVVDVSSKWVLCMLQARKGKIYPNVSTVDNRAVGSSRHRWRHHNCGSDAAHIQWVSVCTVSPVSVQWVDVYAARWVKVVGILRWPAVCLSVCTFLLTHENPAWHLPHLSTTSSCRHTGRIADVTHTQCTPSHIADRLSIDTTLNAQQSIDTTLAASLTDRNTLNWCLLFDLSLSNHEWCKDADHLVLGTVCDT